jgi:hypothetical protein
MSKAKPPTEPASAGQNRAADDSERVPTKGRAWIFLLANAGIAALLAIGTSLVSTFAGNTFWPYLAGAAGAVVAFFLLFIGFLRLRGSIRDAVLYTICKVTQSSERSLPYRIDVTTIT